MKARDGLFLVLLSPPFSSDASSWTVDHSDLWFVTTEPGWGMNIIQQHNIAFATLFVYTPSGSPVWYVASDLRAALPSLNSFQGTLYHSSGPSFSGAFDPSTVQAREVGTMQISFDAINALLTYTVNGVRVDKTITRNTWTLNDYSGNYNGATLGSYSGCGVLTGYREEAVTFVIAHSATSVVIDQIGAATTCRYTGTYTQNGRLGKVRGTATCTDGSRGALSADEMEVTTLGFSGKAIVDYNNGCQWAGVIGGLKRQ